MDRLNQLDITPLLLAHIGLEMFGALAPSPASYNVALGVFGLYLAHQSRLSEVPEQLIRAFNLLFALSLASDVLFYISNGNVGTFSLILNILNIILKPVTVVVSVRTLKSTGISFAAIDPEAIPGGF
ncbi:hypothetical protein M427DRAFT_59102 [Gonapodya prolifera JEL478]|uniref:Uncharacterized protein n=1 Tax=Gonapodya prolifera (strain JEL478) TaxID=1344416 RepID=A0A139A8H4_GONPJ|nr:hypothetical protein M427DRAFT_59102 [Gonapodya prolifera JEL478]|eukprot:KXS12999.1 hypothetical protein M427DRAFT_59102 [Gonapodya prolifera JEL478]